MDTMTAAEKHKFNPDAVKVTDHVKSLQTSIIREVLKISSQPGVISFAGGLPAPEMFPLDDIKEAMKRAIDNHGAPSTQYSLSRGVVPFRELIAQRFTDQGTPSTADNIIITSGSQQGLDILGRAFLEEGDYVLCENPTYLGALQAFNYYKVNYATVEMDHDGMILDEVEDKIKKFSPKFIYTVSNFQNPTGITMSLERREALVELAEKYNILIIDDNPYGDIRFTGEPVRSIKSIGGDNVIELQTFSKILAPGLRIALMNGHTDIIQYFEKVKQATDLHTSTTNQYVIYEFMKAGKLEPHIERLKKDYSAKRETMLKHMREHFPESITWTEPEGGLFLWIELPEHMSAKDLLPKAVENKVAFVYGSPFYANGGGENTMRLNFSNATHEGIEEGIKRLSVIIKDNI